MCWAAKLTRSTSDPLVIHSSPVCQPSTDGGSSSFCPMNPPSSITVYMPLLPPSGTWYSPVRLSVPMMTSVGLLTRWKRACLKKSELNSTRRTERMSWSCSK